MPALAQDAELLQAAAHLGAVLAVLLRQPVGERAIREAEVETHQACRKGHRVIYKRVPRLFDELRLARADGTHHKVLARIARADVLVLDDFAIDPLSEDARRDLLELLEDRYALRATVITSQLKHERWHDFLADPTIADAICDRVIHGAHRLALLGPSRRKTKGAAAPD